MRYNGSGAIDDCGNSNFHGDFHRCVPDSLIGRRAAIDDEGNLDGAELRRNNALHLLVINLLFVALNAIGWAHGAVLRRDNHEGALATLLRCRGQARPIEGLIEDAGVDRVGWGWLAGLELLLGGRQQDQHATHPTCRRRLLPFEQMFGYINPCTSRAVLSIRPQRLYNAKGRSREIRTFWAEYQRWRSPTFEIKGEDSGC